MTRIRIQTPLQKAKRLPALQIHHPSDITNFDSLCQFVQIVDFYAIILINTMYFGIDFRAL